VTISQTSSDSIDSYFIEADDFQNWVGISKANTEQEQNYQEKVKAIVQTLDAFDLLEGLSESEQKALFEAISKIIGA
jgi:hypothetical protein